MTQLVGNLHLHIVGTKVDDSVGFSVNHPIGIPVVGIAGRVVGGRPPNVVGGAVVVIVGPEVILHQGKTKVVPLVGFTVALSVIQPWVVLRVNQVIG